MDTANRARKRGRFRNVGLLDIAGAFDSASHGQLLMGLERAGADVHTRRVVRIRLSEGSLQVKMISPAGVCLNGVYPISRGLPQGGVLSPVSWLMFFNRVLEGLKRLGGREPLVGVESCDVAYADGVTMVISGPTLQQLRKAAWRNVDHLRSILRSMPLQLNEETTENMAFSRGLLPEGISRRTPARRLPNTKKRVELQLRAAAADLPGLLDFDSY